jgi:thymidine phosphorylase
MKTEADSRRLAESLVSIGNASGVKTEAIITAMDAPLGRAVGNALEVIECVDVLKGSGPQDLIDVSVELAARMLVLGRVADDLPAAERTIRDAIASGAGLERFRRIVEAQGGDPSILVAAKPGETVRAGDALLDLHYRDRGRLDTALALTAEAITIGDEPPVARRLIVGEVR